jgi:SNF2 family DNA or RNA helicase
VFFLKKKQKEIKIKLTPTPNGIHIDFLVEGYDHQLDLPMNKKDIEELYKLPGFFKYVAWEELYDSGMINENLISYDNFYQLLDSEEGKEVASTLDLPIIPIETKGILRLDSLPANAQLSLELKNLSGQNLNKIGTRYGAVYEIGQGLYLLPKSIYDLNVALENEYEDAYQKIAVCQKLAGSAGIKVEDFLERERFNVVDSYDLDIKVHSPNHIEVIPKGSSQEETIVLNNPTPVASLREGLNRIRFVRTNKISEDLKHLSQKRHITGLEVPIFLENPSAVLPEHDYEINLELFSERVRGLIPIQRVKPSFGDGSGLQWFDDSQPGNPSYDTDFLRELMIQHPEEQYVQHDGSWIYLDPTLRKTLLEETEDLENKIKQAYSLDIKDNEAELEYEVATNIDLDLNEYVVPNSLIADLFQHQLEGFQWLCSLQDKNRGGLLADDMGLGKTIQVISYLLYQKEKNNLGPTLIILPIALIENWVEEINKFAPALSSSIYIHRGSNRLKSSEVISRYELIFTSYDTLKLDQLILGKIKFKAVICDEAQNAKSHNSQRSRALRAMQSEFRLAMTGTPVENTLDELWTIMDFVQPGYLGSLKEFRKRFYETEDYDGLLQALKPYYLRRTKKEVLDDRLPKKHDPRIEYVNTSNTQAQIVQSMLQTKEVGQVAILNMLMRLRQLYGHPGAVIQQYEDIHFEEAPKLYETLKIIDKIKSRNEKVLIFTEFKKLHSILKRVFMQRYGISVPIIDGETINRQGVVKQFNQSQGFGIMLLSPKAAGVGLTITSANHVIHYTRWWNPAVENQATDRAYRIGQTKDVFVYQIITKDPDNFPNGTVEELMHELLESKRELAENVIIPFNTSEMKNIVGEMLGSKEKNIQ